MGRSIKDAAQEFFGGSIPAVSRQSFPNAGGSTASGQSGRASNAIQEAALRWERRNEPEDDLEPQAQERTEYRNKYGYIVPDEYVRQAAEEVARAQAEEKEAEEKRKAEAENYEKKGVLGRVWDVIRGIDTRAGNAFLSNVSGAAASIAGKDTLVSDVQAAAKLIADKDDGVSVGQALKRLDQQAGNRVVAAASGAAERILDSIGGVINRFGGSVDTENDIFSRWNKNLQAVKAASTEALYGPDGIQNNAVSDWNERRVAVQQQYDEMYQNRYSESPVAQAASKYGTMAWSQAPSAMLAVMLTVANPAAGAEMIAGGLAPATTEGLNFVAALEKSSGFKRLAMLAGNTVGNLARDPQFWYSYSQEAGGAYNEAIQEGADPGTASLYASVYGALSGAIEIQGVFEGGNLEKLPKNIQQALLRGDKAKAAWLYVESILGEIGEEEAQDMVSKLLKTSYRDDIPLYSTDNEDAIINPRSMLETAKDTAITTALMGAGERVVMGASQKVIDTRHYRGDASLLIEQAKQAGGEQSAEAIAKIEKAAESGGLNMGQARELYQIIRDNGGEEAYNEAAKAKNRQQIVGTAVDAAFEGTNLDAKGRETLVNDFTPGETKLSEYIQGVKEAYSLGQKNTTLTQATQSAKRAGVLTAEQFRHAWQLGRGEVTTETNTADVKTEEGKTRLTSELKVMGKHAEAAAAVYNEDQDVSRFAAAMNTAANLYAAQGEKVKDFVAAVREGKAASEIGYLTDQQLATAYQIGEALRQERQDAVKKSAARFETIRAKAQQITAQAASAAQIDKAITEARSFARSEQQEADRLQKEADDLMAMWELPENGQELWENATREAGEHRKNAEKAQETVKELEAKRKEIPATESAETRGRATLASEAGTVNAPDGGSVKYEAVNEAELSKQQKTIVEAVGIIAEELGLDVTIIKAKGSIGGAYLGGGKILLNIYSGMNLKGFSKAIAAGSFSHEMTHWLKEYASEEYDELKQYIRDSMGSEKYDALVKQEQRAQPGLSYEQAEDEVVANACQPMLQNSKAFEQFASEHRNVAEKIRDFLKEFLDKIKAAFAEVDFHDNIPIYNAVKAVENELEGMQEIFDRALVRARENLQAERAVSNQAETRQETGREQADPTAEALENTQPQFSMMGEVEATDKLVAVHNKSVSGLKRMLQRGGVPFPSIAIKKAGTSHEGFGDVSIVFPRSSIDPQVNRQNRLYSNDAWTPTEPRTEYDVGDMWRYMKKLRKEIGDRIYDGLKGGSYLEEDEIAKKLMSSNGNIFEALKDITVLKYAYLKSIGKEPTLPEKTTTLDGFGKYKNEQLLAVFDALTDEEIQNMSYDTEETLKKVSDVLNEQFMKQFEGKYDSTKLAALRKMSPFSPEKINPRIIQDAYYRYKDMGISNEIDFYAFDRELRNNDVVNDPGYREWIESRFKDLIVNEGIPNGKDLFTDSGNRRSFKARHVPATLENIVKQMQKENERGNGLFGVNLRGAATKAYSSVEEMRKDSGKLLGTHVSDDVYDSYMQGFHARLHDLTDEAARHTSDWSAQDSAEQILLETLRDATSKAQMGRLLDKESRWIKVTPELKEALWQLKQDVQNMPAPYFEAKPRRIVYPEEALAYILPDNADSDVMKALEDRGYNVMTYKAGDEQDRLQKLNSVEGAQFQSWDSEESVTDRLDREATDRQHNAWAPTFYSKMENTVNEWTNGKGQPLGAKMAAGQVIGWLKGKGVKAEEIRWSGIVPWLEGRKTVTKDELLQVMAENRVQIETKTLEDTVSGGTTYYQGMDPRDGDERRFNSTDELMDYLDELAEDMGIDPANVEIRNMFTGDFLEIYDRSTGEQITAIRIDGPEKVVNTKWSQYATPGGRNYREILFKMPSLNGYTNNAMRAHWGETDVIAHARVQDMEGNFYKHILFVEEIQSDLHNEGQRKGYDSKPDLVLAARLKDAKMEVDIARRLAHDSLKKSETFSAEFLDRWRETGSEQAYKVTGTSLRDWIRGRSGSAALTAEEDARITAVQAVEAISLNEEAYNLLTDDEWDMVKEIRRKISDFDRATKKYKHLEKSLIKVPDVPFAGSADTYHEYVMKHLLRLAAEGDYDAIAWTTADMQSERWSDEFAEGYKIEYDQEIPKFMRKYVKQWGGSVGFATVGVDEYGERMEAWSVKLNDAMKKDVLTKGQPLFQRWDDTDGDTAAESNGRNLAYTRLQSENKILKDTVKALNKLTGKQSTTIEKLQERLRLNKTPEVREDDAKKMARSLLREYGSKADSEAVARQLKEIGDYILQTSTDKVSEEEIKSRARAVAAEIIDAASEQISVDGEYMAEIVSSIRGKKLTIDDAFLGELDQAGGFEAFRRRNFGKFTLAKRSGSYDASQYMSVSQFYTDLQNNYGKSYFPDAANEGEEIIRIADAFDLARPMEVNPFEQYMGEAVEDLANRIAMDTMGGVLRAEPVKYADVEYRKEKSRNEELNERIKQLEAENALTHEEAGRLWNQVSDLTTKLDLAETQYAALQKSAEARLEQVRAEGRERETEIKAREREKAARDMKALKEYYRRKAKSQKEMRENAARSTKYRAEIERKARKLRDMLLTNSDKLHVPEVLKAPLADFLAGIDMSSKSLLNYDIATQKDQKFHASFGRLLQALSGQQEYFSGTGEVQADMGGYIDISNDNMEFLRRMTEVVAGWMETGETYTINRMNTQQLKDLSNLLSNLTEAIRNLNYFMANARYETVGEAAKGDITRMEELGRASEAENSALYTAAAWENGTPYYVFKRLGEGARAIFDGLTRGWEKMAFNVQEVIRFTEGLYSTKEVNEWKSAQHEITLEDGHKITMTTAQIMELSMLLEREQALKHIEHGGIRVGDIKTRKGRKHDTRHYHLTAGDISKITGLLTERQRFVAKALRNYMASKGSEWGNEISLRRFGYKFYTEGEGYYPIKTDANDRPMADTDAQVNSMFRLLNLSSSKTLNPRASNALIVGDIFETFSDHMADMAKLNGLGLPLLDAIKYFNYKERVDRGDGTYDTVTVQGAMEQAFGSAAQRYYRTLIKDINGVTENGDRGTAIYNKFMSNYKAAAVAANLRVAFLQPTSYVRASFLIKPQYLAGVLPSKAAYAEARKWSGTVNWKEIGGVDTNLARGMRDQIERDGGWKEKLVEKSMILAELGDKITWSRLWTACKRQTKAENRNLSGDELNRATADLFREVIYGTQVMDSTLTRSELMRGRSNATKAMTAFMAEPTLSYNLLFDAVFNAHYDQRKNGKGAWARNSGKIGKAATVYVCSAAWSAVVESVFDAMRDDDDYESFMEKWVQAMFGESGKWWTGNLAQDMTILGKLPYFKNFISTLQGFTSGDMSMTAFNNAVNAAAIWKETYELSAGTLDKATKVTYYGNMTTWGKVHKTLQALSQLSGIAVANLTRDATALWNTAMSLAGHEEKKIKTYDPGQQKSVKNAFLSGAMSEEEAIEKLVESGEAKNQDAAYWTVRGWNGEDKYSEIKAAAFAGDSETFKAEMQQANEHGIKEKTVYSSIRTLIKKVYMGEELEEGDLKIVGDTTLTDEQARRMLRSYGGLSVDDAVKTVNGWKETRTFVQQHGGEYEQYGLTVAQAQYYYSTAKGSVRLQDYAEQVEKYGMDRVKAYYGADGWGKTGLSIAQYDTYATKAAACKGTDANGDGKTDSGSKKAQVMQVINSLPVSNAVKDALYIKNGWSERTINEAPWRRR